MTTAVSDCPTCDASREAGPQSVLRRRYSLGCVWCAARCIQRKPIDGRTRDGLPMTREEVRDARREVLRMWGAHPYRADEQRIRELAGLSEPAYAPSLRVPRCPVQHADPRDRQSAIPACG